MFRKNDPNNELDADAWHPPFLECPVKGALANLEDAQAYYRELSFSRVKSKPHRDVIARSIIIREVNIENSRMSFETFGKISYDIDLFQKDRMLIARI